MAVVQRILADGSILEKIREAAPRDLKLVPLWGLAGTPVLVHACLKEFVVDGGLV